jgi:uncharacterized YigZ family protein
MNGADPIDSYVTVAGAASAELIEKRSRFLSEIRPVSSEEEFAAFLSEKRSSNWDASHNCYAYILKNGGAMRYSDDGEPGGTAGMPILEVLKREELVDAAVIVTRYFGGTLLGTGGLVRAYTASAKLAIDAADRVEICRCVDFSIRADYPLYDRLVLLLTDGGAEVLDTVYEADVTIRARIRAADLDRFTASLTELSGGTLIPEDREECFEAMGAL